MIDKLMVPGVFVAVGLFAYLFYDEFMAIANFLDSTRCSIGMEHYCKGTK